MSKRYYLSPIIGTGDENNPYRPKVADYDVRWAGVIPSDPLTGAPLHPWCLVLVATQNHGQLTADQTINALPDFPLDGKVSAIQTSVKNTMLAKLQARGIDTSFINGTDGYREVIRGIGRTIEPAFDENNFDVVE